MRTNFTIESIERLIDVYVNEYKGSCSVIEEGCLGLGTIILHGANGKKSVLIQEYFINSWASGHSVIKYNKLPKKYTKLIDGI